jgi:hypothetical protein
MFPLTTSVPVPPVRAPSPTSRRRPIALAWMTIACLLLGASGVARSWQDRRHRVESNTVESCPFPLKSIPASLGVWKLTGGGERILDDLTMRITGGTDYILRTYVDEMTGVTLSVLVLFGPAEPVMPHTPEICYPSSGFTPAEDSTDRVIPFDGGMGGRFRSAVYAKPNGRTTLREEVYYSFRLEGSWAPDAGAGRKFPRRNPGVFKVQVQRRVAEGERRDRDDPIEHFLSLLIPAIEQGIASAGGTNRASMGGVSSSSRHGEPTDSLALESPGHPRMGLRPPGKPSRRVASQPGQPIGQQRNAADQADQEQDRREVDHQGQMDSRADRVVEGAGVAIGFGPEPAPGRARGGMNHRRRSLI